MESKETPAHLATTVVIRTIGRATLSAAIESALAENLEVIVVSDGVRLSARPSASPRVVYHQTGRRWNHYGVMGINLGAIVATTEFISILDDDDQLLPGSGGVIDAALNRDVSVDMWIPTLLRKDGSRRCTRDRGLVLGNISHPTYRASIFARVPFTHSWPPETSEFCDYLHVWDCVNAGYRIDWFGADMIALRPMLAGHKGRGL
jgi:hypothetical protein